MESRGDTVSLSCNEYKRMKSKIELLEILTEVKNDRKNGSVEFIENTFRNLRQI